KFLPFRTHSETLADALRGRWPSTTWCSAGPLVCLVLPLKAEPKCICQHGGSEHLAFSSGRLTCGRFCDFRAQRFSNRLVRGPKPLAPCTATRRCAPHRGDAGATVPDPSRLFPYVLVVAPEHALVAIPGAPDLRLHQVFPGPAGATTEICW